MKTVWMDPKFCARYLKTNRISTGDVHYGNLAPGEKELCLLGNHIRGATALEVGCGAAQNSIALAKQGALCTGVDISEPMLRHARSLARKEKVKVALFHGDALFLSDILPKSLQGSFGIAVSSMALGFVSDIAGVFSQVNLFLKPNGRFVFCISHPSQMPHQSNSLSAPSQGQKGWSENYFTINQIVAWLSGTGFMVRRIIEQITINPSKLTAAEKARFPYEPLQLSPLFDPLTHKPHTIIYACRKVEKLEKP